MIREILNATLACVVTFLLCAVGYPAVVYGVGHTLFPRQAEGSLIERDGKVIGSELIAQPFGSDKYFSPRPSAAGPNGYSADAASGSNLATTTPALRERIALDVARQILLRTDDSDLKAKIEGLVGQFGELKTKNGIPEKTDEDTAAITKLETEIGGGRTAVDARASELGETSENHVPVDLVTTSGAGLDPHISPEGARYQASRVAKARGISTDRVMSIIDKHVDTSGALIGAPPRVNVLLLNLDLDAESPKTETSLAPASVRTTPEDKIQPSTSVEHKEAESPAPSPVETLTHRFDQLQERVEAAPIARLDADIKSLKATVSNLSETDAMVKQLKELDEKVTTYGSDLQLTRADLKATRDALSPITALAGLEKQFQTLRSEVETLREASKVPERLVAKPVTALNLAPAAKLFRERQFASASGTLRALADSSPDDARIWYYSALANGFATGQWTGPTEQLALKGVDRERQNSHGSREIDAEFADLPKELGREWLGFYRQKAASR